MKKVFLMLAMLFTVVCSNLWAVPVGSPVPGQPGLVYASTDGKKIKPAPGYTWASDKPNDFRVVKIKRKCSTCHGARFITCRKCHGSRVQRCSSCNGTGNMPGLTYGGCVISCFGGREKCTQCDYIYNSDGTILCGGIDENYGSGKEICPSCDGSGVQ